MITSRLRATLAGTLRRQLVLGVASVYAVMMTLFVWDLTARERAALVEQQARLATALAQSVATSSGDWLVSRDLAGLQEIIEAQRRYPELRFAMVLDRSGEVLAHTDRLRLGQYVRDLPAQPGLRIISRTSALVDVVTPVVVAGHHVGWVRVGVGQLAASAKLNEITRDGLSYALGAIIVGAIMAAFMARQFTRRLDAIQTVADAVRAGNSDVRVSLEGDDEAARLARQFNAMLDTLSVREREIRDHAARNALLGFAIEQLPVSVVITDSDGRINYVNPAFEKVTGYPAAEALGANPRILKSGLKNPDFYRQMWDTLLSGAIWQGEVVNRRKDGSTYIQDLTLAPLRDAEGTTHFVGIGRDVTEVRRLRESLELTQFATDHSTDMVVWVDPEGRVVYTNESARRNLGYTREDLEAMSIWDISASVTGRETWPEIRAQVDQAGTLKIEDEIQRKNGSKLPVEVVVTAVAYGETRLHCAIVRDVSERKRVEEEQLESARVLLESQNVARLGSYRTDLVSGTWTSSATLDEILGIAKPGFQRDVPGWLSIVHPEDRDEMAAYLADEVLGKQQTFDRDYRIIRPGDGEERWVHGIGKLRNNSEGRPVEMIGTIQDVTDRRLAEQRQTHVEAMLHQAQKMEAIGRLAGGVAHDFNNVLAVIMIVGEIAQKQCPPDSPIRGQIDEILKAARRAADLTRQMLAFSRKQVMRPKALELNGVIEGTRKMVSQLIGEDVELVVRLEASGRTVMVDPTQIEQVLMNLAVNARDAMPNGGTLTIETTNVELDEEYAKRHAAGRPGSYVMLSVSDNGIGMDEETQSHIFEPFFTTKPEGKGTGLGLATAYGIVKQSGGFIWVYSEPGRGATFKVYLPSVEGQKQEVEVAAREVSDAPRGTDTILVVEDQETLRKIAHAALERQGYAVLAAADGNAALELASKHKGPIDLLLTDVVMPGMNGHQLAERLSAVRPGIHVLYMSGYSNGMVSDRGLLADDVNLLEKPFTATSLAQAVRNALGKGVK